MRFYISALVFLVWCIPQSAGAQSILMESVALSVWAKPIDTSVKLDPYDQALADRVDVWLMFMVIRTSESLSTAIFEDAVDNIAGDTFGELAPNARVETPHLLDASAGYLVQSNDQLVYYVLAYHENKIYSMLAIDTHGIDEDLDTLNTIAMAAFNTETLTRSPSYVEESVSGFAADFAGEFERPLSHLPGPGELPDAYEFLDKEFLELHAA